MASFTGANIGRIDGGQFISSTNTYLASGSQKKDGYDPATTSPLWPLFQRVAIPATHESAISSYAPRCKPGTRVLVIDDLVNWGRQASDPNQRILWFSGPAGSGKTCIQRDVAIRLQEGSEAGVKPAWVASYFFSNRMAALDPSNPGRKSNPHLVSSPTATAGVLDSIEPFIATIAYQMVRSIPGLSEYVEKAINDDPLIFEKGLGVQARRLISEPLAEWRKTRSLFWATVIPLGLWSPLPKVYPDTVVIDAWDEIRDFTKRELLLNVIRDLALYEAAPLRFIISSRPEHDIRKVFASPEFQPITRHIKLERYNGDSDIRHYICDAFEKVRRTHPASPPVDWPSEEDINTIVDKSSGSFIYPSVVVKFVDNPRKHPIDLLKQVLKQDVSPPQRTGVAQPLAELYSLYDIIFRPADVDMVLLKQVLHSIHALQVIGFKDNTFYDGLLSLPKGTTSILLCDLHSLIDVNGFLKFHHKTAIDYLLDPLASRDIYQPLLETKAQLAACCITHLERWFAQTEEVRLEEIPNLLRHAAYIWSAYVGRALQSRPITPPRGLETFDPRISWMAVFLCGESIYISQNLKDQIPSAHEAMCTVEECNPFCKRIHHLIKVEDCAKAIVAHATKLERWNNMTHRERSETREYKNFIKLLEMN